MAEVLKNDKRAVFQMAAHAERAVTFRTACSRRPAKARMKTWNDRQLLDQPCTNGIGA